MDKTSKPNQNQNYEFAAEFTQILNEQIEAEINNHGEARPDKYKLVSVDPHALDADMTTPKPAGTEAKTIAATAWALIRYVKSLIPAHIIPRG